MTTDAGLKVSNNQWSLRAGKRGPTLLRDSHFYKKQSHFHRERIPEKVVHARGFGVHSLLLDEADIIGGVDPDYHRHDMIQAINRGAYPEYELGVQLISEEDEFKYEFDVLDDTKLWPEETIPVEIIGKMTLNRLVNNFFAEEEQSSFDPSNLVPGIDFSNDPVLQGRAFAYRDTDYHRLGTGNIEYIPINQPIVPVNSNQQNSYVRYRIDVDDVNYHENFLADNMPGEASPAEGGYEHYPEKVEGEITREVPSPSFEDFFSQARLFWNSMSPPEKHNLVKTFSYHVGKVENKTIRQRVVDMFANVDQEMAAKIADNVDANPLAGSHVSVTASSPVLSEANTIYSARTQRVGILIGNGFNREEVNQVINLFNENWVFFDLISEKLGPLTGVNNIVLEANKTFLTTAPVLYDTLYVVGGQAANQAKFDQDIKYFIDLAYKHYKPIGVATTGQPYIQTNGNMAGIVSATNNPNFPNEFINAIAQQRFWDRM